MPQQRTSIHPATQPYSGSSMASYQPSDYAQDNSQVKQADVSSIGESAGYQAPTVDKSASSGDFSGYAAKTFNTGEGPTGENQIAVDKGSTVEGRIGGLLSRTSDYMKRAETRAKQMMNRRGLLNSSMAVGASQAASIDAALPIAQQDAGTYANMQMANQQAENQAAQFNAGTDVQNRQFNASMLQQSNMAQAGYENDAARISADMQQKAKMFNADALNKAAAQFAADRNKESFSVLSANLNGWLKEVDNDLAMQLRSLEGAYSLAENADSVNGAIYQELTRAVANIYTNTKDVDEAKAKVRHLLNAAGYEMEYSNAAPESYGESGPTPQIPRTTDQAAPPAEPQEARAAESAYLSMER